MDIEAVAAELKSRLHTVFDTVYPSPPAAPVFPCAIVHFPTIEQYHVDMAHSISRLSWDVSVCAGRGDTDDAFSTLAKWLGTDEGNPLSVRNALEARVQGQPWLRLSLVRSGNPDVNAESIEVTITIEIDA